MNESLLPYWRIYPKKLTQDKTEKNKKTYLKQSFATFFKKHKFDSMSNIREVHELSEILCSIKDDSYMGTQRNVYK